MAKKLGFVSFFLVACVASFAQSTSLSGQVIVSYRFSHLVKTASNQYAIWIEDEHGAFVRTLFATDFVAKRGGWKLRPQAVPTWTKAADVRNASKNDIDAISGATPEDGSYTVDWDLRDEQGQMVPGGTYRYLIEGNIYWENRVLWSGTIVIGSGPQATNATATFSNPDAEKTGTLISDVSASYAP